MNWAELHEMTSVFRYKPGWRFRLITDYTFSFDAVIEFDDDGGPTTDGRPQTMSPGQVIGHSDDQSPPILLISAMLPDSRNPGDPPNGIPCDWVDSQHVFWTDAKDRDRDHAYWRRWLLECVFLVEKHEVMEYAEFGGFKSFYPAHGPGTALYDVTDKTPRPLERS